jgi:molybdate transport system ATP-binding protein
MLSVNVEGRAGSLSLAAAFDTSVGPVVVTGPNGSGKTSVLHMILGVKTPLRGSVTLDGLTLFDAEKGVNLVLEARRIGYLPQNFGLFPHLSAVENIAFALRCRHAELGARERRERARALLAELAIENLLDVLPGALSAGERQRVALARAIAAEPRALLLDEPFAALDVGTRRQVRVFLREYLERLGLPTVVVSHDAKDAQAVGGRVIVLEGGRIVQTGAWSELRASPASPFVRELTL